VVRPTGIFPIFDPFLAIARRGIAWIPGDGRALTNPVHPLDCVEACVEVLTVGHSISVSVGGPDIVTRKEIVRTAFEAVGKEPRILHIPAPCCFPRPPWCGQCTPTLGRSWSLHLRVHQRVHSPCPRPLSAVAVFRRTGFCGGMT
jgi:nucleoside-diphosphate-sugar epimerase